LRKQSFALTRKDLLWPCLNCRYIIPKKTLNTQVKEIWMKSAEAYKIIDEGWTKKRTGFRVHFQRKIDSEIITDYFQDMDDGPWLSEIAIWRMAWKLAESKKSETPDINAGDLVNICVIEDEGNPIKYYATNRFEVFNQINIKE